jgi:hypothetical protein
VGRRCPVRGVHPSRFGVRLSGRPVSGHLGMVVQRVRRWAVCCLAVRCPGVCCPPVRCPGVWCLPRPSGRVRLLLRRWRWGPSRSGPGDHDHRNGWRPCGCRAVDGSIDGRGGRDAGDAAQVALVSRRPVADPGRRVGCGPRRPRLPAERPGRPGRACGAPVAGGGAVGAGAGCSARWLPRHLAGVLGWVRDHGGWSSLRLTPGWADLEEPLEVPAGMGVRPQRGPSRQ